MTIAAMMLVVAAGYLVVGVPFGVAFAARGAAAIDLVAKHAGWGFRLLILPGAMALWPLLAIKWASALRTPERRT